LKGNHFNSLLRIFTLCVFIQIEDAVVEYFARVMKQDIIIINYNTPQQPKYLAEYIEGWRLKI